VLGPPQLLEEIDHHAHGGLTSLRRILVHLLSWYQVSICKFAFTRGACAHRHVISS
jgi:hypothetical protein